MKKADLGEKNKFYYDEKVLYVVLPSIMRCIGCVPPTADSDHLVLQNFFFMG